MSSQEPRLILEVIHGLKRWLSRKPKLFVIFHPQPMLWGLAFWGEEPGMQLVFRADFTHDDPHRTLLLTGAYVKGTKPRFSFFEPIQIPPEQLIRPDMLAVFVHPVVGKVGETWKGRIIFVDQFKRLHKTGKVEFWFTGPTENPLTAKRNAKPDDTR